MSFTQDFFTSRDNSSLGSNKIGQAGRLWYDSATNTIRISDGLTPGGFVVGQGNGSTYILPIASADKLGGVKVDGVYFNTDINGNLSYNLPKASTSILGGVRVDGTSIVIDENTGVIRATGLNFPSYVLPIAETGINGILGGIRVGKDLHINPATGVLDAAIPQASTTTTGIVKVDGYSIIIDESTGVISATGKFVDENGIPSGGNGGNGGGGSGTTYQLPIAGVEPNGVLGGVIIGNGLSINPTTGVLSLDLPVASTTSLGGVKVDGQTIIIDPITGELTALEGGATLNLLDIGTIDSNNFYTNKITGITKLGFDIESGFDVIDLGNGIAKVAMNSTFKYWNINGQPGLIAVGLDTVNFVAGQGISITANNNSSPKQITISSTSIDQGNLPIAGIGEAGTLGGVKVDGTSIIINDTGVITATGLVDGKVTYQLDSNNLTDGAELLLIGSDSTVDSIKLEAGDNVTISKTNSNTITISSNVSGTESYTLPTASTTILGGVKVDGTSITIDSNGVISGASTYTLPTASTTILGGVKVDGTSITIDNGVIGISSTVGTVKSFSFTNANGFIGSVLTSTTNPRLTLSISSNGVLKGVSGSIQNAIPGIDYQTPLVLTTTDIKGKSTLSDNVLNIPQYQGQITLTTTGNGPATFINDVLNIPQYGNVSSVGISSTDLTITGSPITSSGTINLTLRTVPISKGGTGATNKDQAFTNLSPTNAKGDIIYHDGVSNKRLPVGDIGSILRISTEGIPDWGLFTEANVIYVSKFGDDISGDGSLFKPYGTLSNALNSFIYTGVYDNPVVIKMGPGTYNESIILLKRNTFIIGSGTKNTKIICTGIELGPTFVSNAPIKTGIHDIAFDISDISKFDLDCLTIESEKSEFYFDNVDFLGKVVTNSRSQFNYMVFTNCYIETLEVNGGWYNIFNSCRILNVAVLNPNSLGYLSNATYIYIYNTYFTSHLKVNLVGQDFFSRLFVFLYGVHWNITSELQIYNTNGGVYATAESIPNKDRVKNFDNSYIYRLNDAYGIQYIPINNNIWDPVPDNVQDALDNLIDLVKAPGRTFVSSIDISGGTTGLTTTGGPVTSSGTITLNGVLKVSHGGTGKIAFENGYIKSDGVDLFSSSRILGADVFGDITGKSSNITGIVQIVNGGTGSSNRQTAINNLTGTQTPNTVLRSDGTNVLLDKVNVTTDVTGILSISNGGTSASSRQLAINNLTGTQISNTVLRSDGANVTLSKVNVTTDVTGILTIANGGTGSNNRQTAINSLAGIQIPNTVLRSDGINVSLDKLNATTDVTGILSILNGGTGADNKVDAFNNLAPDQEQFSGYVLSTDGTSASWVDAKFLAVPDQTGNEGKYLRTNGVTTYWEDVIPKPAGMNKQLQFNNNGVFSATGKMTYESIGELVVGSGSSDDFNFKGLNAINELMSGTSVNIKAGDMFASQEGLFVPPAGNVYLTAGGGISQGVPGFIGFNVGRQQEESFRITNTGAWSFTKDDEETGSLGQFLMSYGMERTPEWTDLPNATYTQKGIIQILEHNSQSNTSGLELIQNPTSTVQNDLILRAIIRDVDNSTILLNNGQLRVDDNEIKNRIIPNQSSNIGKYLRTNGSNLYWDDYTSTIASVDTLGSVKIDDSTITIDGQGVISVNLSTVTSEVINNFPIATSTVYGSVKIDGESIVFNENEQISLNVSNLYDNFTLQQNSVTNKIFANVNNILPSQTNNELKYLRTDGADIYWSDIALTFIASETELGGVKIDGSTINIDINGVISANINNLLPEKPENINTFLTSDGTDIYWSETTYVLPIASSSILGGVKVDGNTISITEDGILIGAPTYVLPTASTTVLGGVKVDGTTILIDDGIISGTPKYTLPIASETILGGVKVDGSTIAINQDGVLSNISTYTLPTSSTTILGGVKVDGSTITITADGVISGNPEYVLPTASSTTLGGVKVDGSTITIDQDGIISGIPRYILPIATETELGGVKVDGTTILIDEDGVISGVSTYILPTATTTILGGVKVDGTTISIDGNGVITSIASTGTVSSIDISGGTTGLTTEGGPITIDGTITLGGTLSISHGGTGANNKVDGLKNLLPSYGISDEGKSLVINNESLGWGSPTAIPAGLSGQLQFNNAGVTSGTSRMVYNGTSDLILGIPNNGSPTETTFNILGASSTVSNEPSNLLIRSGAQNNVNSYPSNVYIQGGYGLAPVSRGGNVYIDGGISSFDIGGSVVLRTAEGFAEPLVDRLVINNYGAFGIDNVFGLENQVLTSNGPNAPPLWRFQVANAGELTGDTIASNVLYSNLTTLGVLSELKVDGNLGIGTSMPEVKLSVAVADDNVTFEFNPDETLSTFTTVNKLDDTLQPLKIQASEIIFATGETLAQDRFVINSTGQWLLNGISGNVGDVLMSNGEDEPPAWKVYAPKYEEITVVEGQLIINTQVKTVANSNGNTYLQVFRNGVLQKEGLNKAYTVTGENQITFTYSLSQGDDITLYSFILN